jgi:cellulose synthase/poly-beta-1,6-N-acetylglucosamine synthase-like glycosyltransferase
LSIIVFVIGLAVWLTLFISFIFFLQTLFAALSWRRYGEVPDLNNLKSVPAAFLIPAHNEEEVITKTLESIKSEVEEGDEIVVVADNCADSTRQLAEGYGVTVLERFDEDNKGKGFALDYGLAYLKQKEFGVIIIVDADCTLTKGCRKQLVNEVIVHNRPVQALYMMESVGSNLPQKFAKFTWAIKNKIRPLGLLTCGGPCQLTGTGMAFPAKSLQDTDIASGCIVEDMKLGLDLAIAGQAPKLLPTTTVWSEFPDSENVAQGQKSRWVHGHIEMIFTYIPKLTRQFSKTFDYCLLLLILDLLIPPLMILVVFNLVLLVLTLALTLLSMSSMYFLSILSMLLLGLGIFISWVLEGRNYLSLKELYLGGLGLLKKLALYTQFFTDKRSEWNKTSRK